MLHSYINSLILALLVVLAGCSTDLEIPFPKHEPKLTLNSFLTPGEPIDLYLTRSFGTLENIDIDEILIRDSKVELFRDGNLIDEMTFVDTLFVDTVYSFSYPLGPGLPDTTVYYTEERQTAKYIPSTNIDLPKAGETYRFVVTHPTYGTASAETTLPAKPILIDGSVVKDSIITRDFDDGYQDKWTAVKIRVDDPAGENNFYNFGAAVQAVNNEFAPQIDTFYNWNWATTEIVRDVDGIVYGERGPVSDEEIDGTRGVLYAWIQLPGCCGYSTDIQREQYYEYLDVNVRVVAMTEAYARFQEKLQLQSESRLDGIESAFLPTEPVVIPSNVEGGYGVVGSFNVAEIKIEF